MAGTAAKKALKAKQKASSTLLPCVLAVDLFYVVVRLVLRWSSATRWQVFALVFLNVLYGATFSTACEASTAPAGSISEYVFDLFVVSLAAQALAAVSEKGWWLLAVVPAFILYKAATYFRDRKPTPKQPDDNDEDQDPKKAIKQKIKRGRR
mmetsp:Transcript_37795/g.121277  ORF Transcript_37795/g.121277 Transcript_37795/m.121277 type:complete len:152 (+) Transcript_37795:77-532(+)|eukprot:CAMPEP_0118897574 /NCGR_PEP_ID=MMETSP1166-20130328/4911_1 /TAXON_ID=1104430 /ORGANISM="Chrysoreinhardia sp, Strain CCMP3193" /LENGTH=151 /DNA_ID=CAMNT_0006836651 /DNA_START=62 /DNA_END=517 /DNA_ORIENTATION=+